MMQFTTTNKDDREYSTCHKSLSKLLSDKKTWKTIGNSGWVEKKNHLHNWIPIVALSSSKSLSHNIAFVKVVLTLLNKFYSVSLTEPVAKK